MKLDISEATVLVEIVSNCTDKHMIYCIGPDGLVVENYHIKNASIDEVIDIIPHMRIIAFSEMDMWNVHCQCMFNQIFEPSIIAYDNIYAWNIGELIDIIIHLCNIKNVLNYEEDDDYQIGEQLIYEYVNARPTPIEETSEEIHMQGVESRRKFLKLITEFII